MKLRLKASIGKQAGPVAYVMAQYYDRSSKPQALTVPLAALQEGFEVDPDDIDGAGPFDILKKHGVEDLRYLEDLVGAFINKSDSKRDLSSAMGAFLTGERKNLGLNLDEVLLGVGLDEASAKAVFGTLGN
jgi:hypothetical protein